MFSSLTVVVFMSAVLVIFSKEMGAFAKKMFAIPSIALLLPLLLTTFFVVELENYVTAVLTYIWIFLHVGPNWLSTFFPYPGFFHVLFSILLLTLLTMIPVSLVQYLYRKRSLFDFPWSVTLGLLIWLVCAILMAL